MSRHRSSFVIAALAVAALLGSTAAAAPVAPVPRGLVEGNTAFALDLYARLRDQPGNLFFSPASISTALALTYAGARGETAAQMKRTLRLTLPPKQLHAAFGSLLAGLESSGEGGPEVAVANRLWVQAGTHLLADFQQVARAHYGAEAQQVDFVTALEATRKRINDAVARATRGRIEQILPPGSLDALVRLVLTSAIYFKGRWEQEFPPAATRDAAFTVKPGVERHVPMMHNSALRTRYGATDDAQVLELPYRGAKDRAFAMVVILPTKVDGLAALEGGLTPKSLAALLATLKPVKKVRASLPRFTARHELALGRTLAGMGMPLAFDQRRADFTGLTKLGELYLARVLHQAFVDVNESGTEAAAATGVVVSLRNGGHTPTFVADHPFLYLIRDTQTGSVLFMGRLVDPGPGPGR